MNPILRVVGKTPDGKTVVDGIFTMVATYGVPLDVVVSFLDDRGHVPDWVSFYKQAVREGWPSDRTLLRLEAVVGDVYGPVYREEWKKRMGLALCTI